MRHKIWLLGIFLFTLFLIGCQEDAVIEPQANVAENSGNLGKITIKKQLVVTDSLMAIEIMNDAYQHYLIAGTYETYSINPEYMVEDTLGNDQFWFDFFWYVDAFGGDYHIINLQPYYMEYNQFFYVTSTNARIWGTDMTTLTESCDNQMDDNYDGEIDEGCWTAIDVDNDGWLDNINPNDPTRQLDCDDNEPNINPGANEIYYNGLDENCNGMEDDFLPFEADINLEDLYDGNVSLYHPFDLITLTFPDFILTSGKNFKFEVSGYAEALTGAWLFSESPAFFTPNVFTHTNPEWLYEMGQNTFLDRIIRFDGEWPESIWPPNFNQEGIYYRMISGNGQQISVNLWSAIGNGSVGHPVGTFHIKLIEVTD